MGIGGLIQTDPLLGSVLLVCFAFGCAMFFKQIADVEWWILKTIYRGYKWIRGRKKNDKRRMDGYMGKNL